MGLEQVIITSGVEGVLTGSIFHAFASALYYEPQKIPRTTRESFSNFVGRFLDKRNMRFGLFVTIGSVIVYATYNALEYVNIV